MSDETKMTNVAEVYKARRKLEQEGIWCKLPAGRIKLKSAMRNPEFTRKVQPFANKLGEIQEDESIFRDIVEVLAETIVIDWDGFGEDYTAERFVEFCTELRECGFTEDVLQFVMDKELFNQVAVAKTAKN